MHTVCFWKSFLFFHFLLFFFSFFDETLKVTSFLWGLVWCEISAFNPLLPFCLKLLKNKTKTHRSFPILWEKFILSQKNIFFVGGGFVLKHCSRELSSFEQGFILLLLYNIPLRIRTLPWGGKKKEKKKWCHNWKISKLRIWNTAEQNDICHATLTQVSFYAIATIL